MHNSIPNPVLHFGAVMLAVALFAAPFSPLTLFVSAQTDDRSIEARECERNDGVWDSATDTCEEPVDLCPNVPGNQDTTPCADTECEAEGGTWDSATGECDIPPTPEEQCVLDGGTWDATTSECDMPLTAEEQCDLDGGTWDSATSSCEMPPTPEEQCILDGGTWNGTSCDDPAPAPASAPTTDLCPNVPGDQDTTPCADEECEANNGTWNGTDCETSAPTTAAAGPTDVCPNVPGDQSAGPCADEECEANNGTWNGTDCDDPPVVASLAASSSGGSAVAAEDDEEASSSTTNSGEVDPDESGTDNTDFTDITSGGNPCASGGCITQGVNATTTEEATEPLVATDSAEDGTGSKTGSTIFTGNSDSHLDLKNTLNTSRANGIDVPGQTNGTFITAEFENDGELTTGGEAEASTGDNRSDGGTGTATVVTGNAVSTGEVLNVVNTNLFNSDGLVLFLNPLNGDGFNLNDFDLSYFFNEGPGGSPTQYGCTVLTCLNSSALSILNKNTASVDNQVRVRASTGANHATTTEDGDVSVETGNAFAAANVLNLVNTNFINSSYLVLSLSNFGDLNDDIVLPGAGFFDQLFEAGNTLPDLNSSSFIVDNNNDENFFGTTTATALTGGNTAYTILPGGNATSTLDGHGEILTGEAFTSSESFTAANQTRVGGASVRFVFRVWGDWSGEIKGLPDGLTVEETDYGFEIVSGGRGSGRGSSGGSGDFFGEYNSSAFIASSTNIADVKTNVEVIAETGDNVAAVEDGVGLISTGDAFAAANVINMVNTTVVNRNWVFAVFNIYGDWSGDISFGGHNPDLLVEAGVQAPDPTTTGSDVSYTFTVTNRGSVAASTPSLQIDYDKQLLEYTSGTSGSTETSSGRKWDIGSLDPGDSATILASARVLADDIPSGISANVQLSATALLDASQRDQNDADNSATVNIAVVSNATSSGSGSSSGSDRGEGRDRGGSSGGSGGGGSTGGGGGGGNSNEDSSSDSSDDSSDSSNSPPAPPVVSDATITKESNSSGGGGGGGGSNSRDDESIGRPDVKLTKEASISTTTLPALVNYKIVVRNERYADGPLYDAVLKDTLRGPDGEIITERAWPLDDVVIGDLITLTYSVSYAATSSPGTYTNEAVVTGSRGDGGFLRSAPTLEASADVNLVPGFGYVLGASCTALLTQSLGAGEPNPPSEVRKLQEFLATDSAVYPAGLVTGYYGPLTSAAVTRFQEKYAADVLYPLGLSRGTGFAGPSTIKKINELHCGGAPVASSTSTPPENNDQVQQQPAQTAPSQTYVAPAQAIRSILPAQSDSGDDGNLFGTLGSWFSQLSPIF